MSEANTMPDGLPEESVVMRLTEGAVPENPSRYADKILDSADRRIRLSFKRHKRAETQCACRDEYERAAEHKHIAQGLALALEHIAEAKHIKNE